MSGTTMNKLKESFTIMKAITTKTLNSIENDDSIPRYSTYM